jgi:hypothetical protein
VGPLLLGFAVGAASGTLALAHGCGPTAALVIYSVVGHTVVLLIGYALSLRTSQAAQSVRSLPVARLEILILHNIAP